MFIDLTRKKKLLFDKTIRENLNNCTSPTSFWKAIKRFKGNSSHAITISEEEWINFQKTVLPLRMKSTKKYEGNECDEVETAFTKEEIMLAFKKSPINKSAGPDAITNEFLKNLPDNGVSWIAEIFNYILVTEKPPNQWTESITAMIIKKAIIKIQQITDLYLFLII